MKNCIIIDDEMMARAIISELVTTKSSMNVVAEFSNAIEALKYLNKNKVDLIFLDIHMPDFNGFDFINTIKHPVNVILVTSDKNFAIDAFEYDCIVDYLVKPITEERFEKAMLKLKEVDGRFNKNQKATESRIDSDSSREFYINKNNRLIKIDVNTILYFMAKGDYVYLKTETNNYTIHNTLKKIESKLPKDLFFKGHRSYIINTKKIIDIEDNSVLIGKDVIPISRRNRPELMKRVLLL
nr:LytTR family DNA-binding domain-containing protein [uncultured Flavobacterium sp.]